MEYYIIFKNHVFKSIKKRENALNTNLNSKVFNKSPTSHKMFLTKMLTFAFS